MARIATIETSVAPARVWEILADGWRYAAWVVGASRIRAVDPAWPQRDTRIHHSVGLWPLLLDDHTEVREVVRERQLVLRARAWLFGKAEIAISLEPDHDGGTRITMAEHVVEGPYALVPDRVQEEMVLPRNQECLRRLVLLAEGATE
ncbi:polyketide cyclase [Rhodococcus pyridinivorans KG-16]|uniref:Polyketide cyclase n=1 Tax=Rhodococcus pyridinivorans KG-16 TaxID=1441730 RepID=A0A0V9URB1_9NOCA|nr:SRPBCC family protein [Rhodococcus pyridinivorans]KSZ60535.1 polyketide cyclase [Rhodococcus pyridinivorans KG-16]